MRLVIFGTGAWGTAVGINLAKNGKNSVILIPHLDIHAKQMQIDRENKEYLPGCVLPDNLEIETFDDFFENCEFEKPENCTFKKLENYEFEKPENCEFGKLENCNRTKDVWFFACPSFGVPDLCKKLIAKRVFPRAIVTLCKGIDQKTLKTQTSIVKEYFPNCFIGTLSGPTYAKEVAIGKPCAAVLASDQFDEILIEIQEAVNNPFFRIYRSKDLFGVEIAGSMKNVYAIGAGICDGLELGDNAKAAYLSRAIHEMCEIGVSLGGLKQTFYGLAGFGDLIATCEGKWSRNRTFGEQISRGKKIEDIINEQKAVVEGYLSTECFFKMNKQNKIQAPILDEIYAVLFLGKNPKDSIPTLMNRLLKSE